jgi:ribosomal protein S18 acetylase RimI-like enzyme
VLTYQRAEESDVPDIQRVVAESWSVTYRDIFTPEFVADFLARSYSTEGLIRSVRNPGAIFLVAKDGSQIVGFCHYGIGRQGPELFRMYVLPGYWRSGAGTEFLRLLEAQLAERGVGEYFCYVHTRNEIGKAFYVKQGFVHDAARDREDESCMVKRLVGLRQAFSPFR